LTSAYFETSTQVLIASFGLSKNMNSGMRWAFRPSWMIWPSNSSRHIAARVASAAR